MEGDRQLHERILYRVLSRRPVGENGQRVAIQPPAVRVVQLRQRVGPQRLPLAVTSPCMKNVPARGFRLLRR
jgi:hypothetical protein